MFNADRVKLIIQCFHSASQVRFQVSDKASEKKLIISFLWGKEKKVFFSTVKARGGKCMEKEKKKNYLFFSHFFQIESQPSSGTYLAKWVLLVFRVFELFHLILFPFPLMARKAKILSEGLPRLTKGSINKAQYFYSKRS